MELRKSIIQHCGGLPTGPGTGPALVWPDIRGLNIRVNRKRVTIPWAEVVSVKAGLMFTELTISVEGTHVTVMFGDGKRGFLHLSQLVGAAGRKLPEWEPPKGWEPTPLQIVMIAAGSIAAIVALLLIAAMANK
jgi:hypothetical protein